MTPIYVAFKDSQRLFGDAAQNLTVRNLENTVLDTKELNGSVGHKRWPFMVISGADDKLMIQVLKPASRLRSLTVRLGSGKNLVCSN